MAGAPHDGAPAGARDFVVHRARARAPAAHGRARHLLQDRSREQDHQLIAPQDAAAGVDDADAVGVTVERHAQFGADLGHLGDEIGQVGLYGRVGMMMGKAPGGLTVELGDLEAEASQQHGRHATGAVAGIDDHLEAARTELDA